MFAFFRVWAEEIQSKIRISVACQEIVWLICMMVNQVKEVWLRLLFFLLCRTQLFKHLIQQVLEFDPACRCHFIIHRRSASRQPAVCTAPSKQGLNLHLTMSSRSHASRDPDIDIVECWICGMKWIWNLDGHRITLYHWDSKLGEAAMSGGRAWRSHASVF